MRRVILGLLAGVVLFLVVFGAGGGNEASAGSVNPILFVHGFNGNTSAWITMKNRFIANGWPSSKIYYVSYGTGASNVDVAYDIARKVQAIQKANNYAKVDIIAHSMGSLSSRYYLKKLAGSVYVDEWVSLGGPNHGTDWAWACWALLTPCRQMVPGSSFLKTLNSGDETPGSVRYRTWWSPCDEWVNPDSSVILSGATNTRTFCIGHSSLLTNATVYKQVRDFVK